MDAESLANYNNSFCNQTTHSTPALIAFCSSGCLCSFLCAVAIFVMFIMKVLKSLAHRLILYMLISVLIYSLAVVTQISGVWLDFWNGKYGYVCIIESVLLQYSCWVMFLSTFMMTLYLATIVLFPSCYESMTKLEPFYIIFPWTFPLLTTAIPFIHQNYGISGSWCWIRLYNENCTINKEGIIEIYALWYGDLTVGLILNNVALIAIVITLCKRSYISIVSLDYRKALRRTLPLIFYPITYQFLTCFAIANRIYESVSNGNSPNWMLYLHAVTGPSWGLFAPIFTLIYFAIISKCCNIRQHCNEKYTVPNAVINDLDDPSKRLIDTDDHLTNYGTTVAYPTEYRFRTESEADQEYEKQCQVDKVVN